LTDLDMARLKQINDANRAECGHTGDGGCAWCWLTAEQVARQPYAERLAAALDLDHLLTDLGVPRPPRAVAIVHGQRTYAVQIMDERIGTWELRIPAPGEAFELYHGPMWSDPDQQTRHEHSPQWIRGTHTPRHIAEGFAAFLRERGLTS
jgi:hypothetical protein